MSGCIEKEIWIQVKNLISVEIIFLDNSAQEIECYTSVRYAEVIFRIIECYNAVRKLGVDCLWEFIWESGRARSRMRMRPLPLTAPEALVKAYTGGGARARRHYL